MRKIPIFFPVATPCNWNINSGNPRWELHNASIGAANNVIVSPKDKGAYYLGTSLTEPSKNIAYLESAPFSVTATRFLKFTEQRGTYSSELWGCKNSLDLTLQSPNCQRFAGPSLTADEYRGTQTKLVELTPQDSKVSPNQALLGGVFSRAFSFRSRSMQIFLIARHTNFNYGAAAFGIDNIQLADGQGNSLCKSGN